MVNESNIRRDKHCIFKLNMHWVFESKSRHRVFDAREIDVPRSIFAEVCADAQTTRVEMYGEKDHVYLLVEYPPKLAISSLVNSFKVVPAPIRIVRQYIQQQKTRSDIHDSFAVGAILPRPEGRGRPSVLVSYVREARETPRGAPI